MGWDWSLNTSGAWKNHPQLVGKITNDIVYKKLPKGVLDELNRLNPKDDKGNRKHKHHQLSLDMPMKIENYSKISASNEDNDFDEKLKTAINYNPKD